MTQEIETWIASASKTLQEHWGLDKAFSSNVALLFLYFVKYGLSPVITSGWRSPEKQEELMLRYKAGDPSIRYKPAENSKHLNTNWLGSPASLAVDISTNNPSYAAEIARYLKIKPGNDFGDPVHFYI